MSNPHLARATEIVAALGLDDNAKTLAYLSAMLEAEYWRGHQDAAQKALEIIARPKTVAGAST